MKVFTSVGARVAWWFSLVPVGGETAKEIQDYRDRQW